MMDDDQQFCLRWNNHQSTLISVFDTLLENETLVDCTLAAEGKFLKAHKVVLSACSPYFATLLQEQYDKHPIFILKDVKYQELRAMMDYMYRGEVNISQDQLAALLKAAESLQIKGLSDNRSSSAPKPEHQQRGLHLPGAGGKMGGSYTLEAQTKRARMGPTIMDSQDMSGTREGSSSPTRRRRKIRRRSIENVMSDVHDNSNSSLLQAQQSALMQQQSNAALAGVGAITAAASALASQLPGTMAAAATTAQHQVAVAAASVQQQQQQQMTTTSINKKTESAKGTSDAMNTENLQATVSTAVVSAAAAGDEQNLDGGKAANEQQQQQKQNHKQQKSSAGKDGGSDLVIEPKSEYDEDANEETVEDLTLDEEDMGMEELDQNAGTSQGGETSSQGYAPWQHERTQDELLLATQEAQQRDPQGCITSSSSAASTTTSSQTPPPQQQQLIQDYWYELKFSDLFKFINRDGRYQCPRYNCLKSYKDASSLQRHIRYECGGQKKFRCLMCGKAFSQSSHLKRHLESGVCVKYYL